MPKSNKNLDEEGTIPWQKGGVAYSLLKHMFTNGDLEGNEQPMSVRESNEIFKKVNKTSFRAGWSRLKAELGVHVRSTPMACKPAANFGGGKTTMSGIGSEDEYEDDYNSTTGSVIHKKTFNHNHLKSEENLRAHARESTSVDIRTFLKWDPPFMVVPWEDTDAKTKISVVVNMCAGTPLASDTKVSVEKGGLKLLVSTKWPNLMTDHHHLHKFWNKAVIPTGGNSKKGPSRPDHPMFPGIHPKMMAFDKLYRKLKSTKSSDIWSQAQIDLPFQVLEDDLEIHRIADKKSGAMTLYVNLKGFGNSNYESNDSETIIMIE